MTIETQDDQISSREVALRTIAAMNAQASNEMEGLTPSPEATEDMMAWVTGKISIEDALARALVRHTRT